MKKSNLAILVVSFIVFWGTVSIAAELQNGFMDYKWGDSVSQYRGLTELYTKKDVTYYSNPGETYTIDDITINNVVLGFYKDALFAVYIGIDTPETYDEIKLHMKQKYGLPDTKLKFGFPDKNASARDRLTIFKWKYQDITIKLKTDEIEGKMKLAFYYRPISRELKKDHLDEVSETSFRFFPIDKNEKPKMIPFLEF